MRRTLVFVFMFLLFAGFASATTTTHIVIKTVSFGDVSLNVKDYSGTEVYDILTEMADGYGDLEFFYNSSEKNFNIGYYVKDRNGAKVSKGLLEHVIAGEEIYLEVVPEGYELLENPFKEKETEANETENVTEAANSTEELNETIELNDTEILEYELNTEETKEKTEKVTAFSISKDSVSISTQIIYYAIGIIVIVVLLFIFLRKRKNRVPSDREIKVKKLSELKKDKEERIKEQQDVIEEAEKKLEAAKKELESIKKEDKISDLKKKIIEEEKELMRLRKEDSDKKEKDKDEE